MNQLLCIRYMLAGDPPCTSAEWEYIVQLDDFLHAWGLPPEALKWEG